MRVLFGALLLFSLLNATLVEGEAYSIDSIFPLPGVIFKAVGPITVQEVLGEGNYSVELPPGQYKISAYYYVDGELMYYVQENIIVEGEWMHYDLVLFPQDEFEEVVPFVSYEIGDVPVEEIEPPAGDGIMQAMAGIIIVLFFMLGFVLYYFVFNKQANEAVAGMGESKPHAVFRKELDPEEKEVLEILKKSEGMSTQKELRGILKCTDSKMSLLISSLEARGLVKRIKRGREKIVKLCNK
jgi:uncharacterized membrane protein